MGRSLAMRTRLPANFEFEVENIKVMKRQSSSKC